MKTVKYQGKKFEVSDWVRYIAIDEDGSMWGFENKPELNIYEDMWITSFGRYEQISDTFNYWENSLEKV